MVAFRLFIDVHGKLRGPGAKIRHNDPWPCPNGEFTLSPPMRGALMHTNVGTLPSCVARFNDDNAQASAHFEIGGPWSNTDGEIWQFGPIGRWMAWHAMNANGSYFGIEFEDGGTPRHPLTDRQLTAGAQVLEALSAHRRWGFPLRVTNSTRGKGLGAHYLGGASWGGHTCPDVPPGGEGPRSHQRHEVVRRAKILRVHGRYPAHVAPVTVTADGSLSLKDYATVHKLAVADVLSHTVSTTGLFSEGLSHYMQAGSLRAPVPRGEKLVVAHGGGNLAAPVKTPQLVDRWGGSSLVDVSKTYTLPVSTILRYTLQQFTHFDVGIAGYLQDGDLAAALPDGGRLIVGGKE